MTWVHQLVKNCKINNMPITVKTKPINLFNPLRKESVTKERNPFANKILMRSTPIKVPTTIERKK